MRVDGSSAALIWAGFTEPPPLGRCVQCSGFLGELCVAAAPGVIETSTRGGAPVLLCFDCAGEIGVRHYPVRLAKRRAIREIRKRLIAASS